MSNLRFKSVEEATARKAVKVELPKERVEAYYARQVFNRQRMFEYLPKETYDALVEAIDNRKPLSRELADSVAEGTRERRPPLHPLVPSADGQHGREARRLHRA